MIIDNRAGLLNYRADSSNNINKHRAASSYAHDVIIICSFFIMDSIITIFVVQSIRIYESLRSIIIFPKNPRSTELNGQEQQQQQPASVVMGLRYYIFLVVFLLSNPLLASASCAVHWSSSKIGGVLNNSNNKQQCHQQLCLDDTCQKDSFRLWFVVDCCCPDVFGLCAPCCK